MNKHTPAPWSCSNEGWGNLRAQVRGADHELVCEIPIYFDCPSGDGDYYKNEFHWGDRALILAAPELLKAAIEWMEDPLGDPDPLRNAIARARGIRP